MNVDVGADVDIDYMYVSNLHTWHFYSVPLPGIHSEDHMGSERSLYGPWEHCQYQVLDARTEHI